MTIKHLGMLREGQILTIRISKCLFKIWNHFKTWDFPFLNKKLGFQMKTLQNKDKNKFSNQHPHGQMVKMAKFQQT